ncbi:D-alanyl-D-alanine carboxypeptidase/D-alanyl-D-alanine-endopeptidase [Kitasatospora kazusensis]|uniref:D-alanyl-D-alanine carboxypeptidase/D-alanyl-D-alanine-endopeptidase n=1 Tax=Kitasatospora kazusensis TaxID=407974 RepID=A0ABN2ZDC2_9ACTN
MALAAAGLTLEPGNALAQPVPGPSRSPGKVSHDALGLAPAARRQAVALDGPVLAAAVAGTEALPTTQGLQRDLGPLLQDKSLGTLNLAVADAATGQLLFGSGENTPATPASTTKLLTTVAALALIPQDTRISTKAVLGPGPGEITLVGGGDPTLTGLPLDQYRVATLPVDADTAPASMIELARQTAAALKAAGTTSVKLNFDTSLYSGPVLHPQNDSTNIAAVTPLMVDEGRAEPRDQEEAPSRVFDPAGQAADVFTTLLQAQGITVQGKPKPGTAAPGARLLGQVQSPTMARLIERLLTTSDNTLAEAVARQAALAAHQPASFDGAVKAVTDTLSRLGVPMNGVVLYDGSGLHTGDLIPPLVLAKVLALAGSPQHPELRPVLTGMPIAGFTGTLATRFGATSGAQNAAGLVRAKTGSLSGINTLAGTVVDADGRVLVFALMTRTTAGAVDARSAVDRIVARLAACACR